MDYYSYGEIAGKYPNICNIFSEDWFDRELMTNFDERHLIAKLILNFENTYIVHLEQDIGFLMEEIKSKRKHFNRLLDMSHFQQTRAEIEIGALFKKMGFTIKFEQIIPDSKKSSDIKVNDSEFEAFIEIRTIKNKDGELIEDHGGSRITTSILSHKSIDYKDKIEDEIHGLSKEFPGIIVLYLEPGIVNYRAIRLAFYDAELYCDTNKNPFHQLGESAAQNSEISALILYKHWHINNECREHKKLYLNHNSNKPLSEKFIALLKEKGFDIEKPENYVND